MDVGSGHYYHNTEAPERLQGFENVTGDFHSQSVEQDFNNKKKQTNIENKNKKMNALETNAAFNPISLFVRL